jgi:alkanesulfonate monooxygenase SsuD/methylene tetrahydromethanopterin reductase-like flavin-dependent oxidoreductase (luciferase family)
MIVAGHEGCSDPPGESDVARIIHRDPIYHFIPITGSTDGPELEGWTTLAALAARTDKIRVGVLVTGNTYRNPAVLAKMATTVDLISNGRLDFGIGAGWFEFEHTAYGIPFYDDKERADRLAEAMQVIRLLWTADHPSLDGKFYDLHHAPFLPKPVQTPYPRVVIGGKGKKWIMPTVARYADEWNAPVGVGPDGIKRRIALLREECARIGRTPCVERVSVLMPLINISNVPLAGTATRLGARLLVERRIADALLAGSPDEIKDVIRQHVDAGVTRVILNLRPPFDRELMRRFAQEIMPAFRPAATPGTGAGS